jgi:hypothetical protein
MDHVPNLTREDVQESTGMTADFLTLRVRIGRGLCGEFVEEYGCGGTPESLGGMAVDSVRSVVGWDASFSL